MYACVTQPGETGDAQTNSTFSSRRIVFYVGFLSTTQPTTTTAQNPPGDSLERDERSYYRMIIQYLYMYIYAV